MTRKDKLAQFIRIISIPPIVVTALIIILANTRKDIFHSTLDIIIPIIFLGIVPILAYPLQKYLPKYKNMGRNGQRKLAFICSFIGYTGSFIWVFLSNVSTELLIICSTYFLSVILLAILNKVMHLRASGHACSVTGPIVILIYFVDFKMILPCLIYLGLIVWSSLYLKRHTKKDLILGCIVCLLAFLTSLLIFNL